MSDSRETLWERFTCSVWSGPICYFAAVLVIAIFGHGLGLW